MDKDRGARRIESSFRDPDGHVFIHEDILYRQVNKTYEEDYNHLIDSGLYHNLVNRGLLIPHTEVDLDYRVSDSAVKILKPEEVWFISYPYEWCFSQLKDAALATLEIQKIALEHGMTLKDCSAYNIQFHKGKPVFIDTLSFERYRGGEPWIPYKQFCEHFLAPLALMSKKDVRLNQLSRIYVEGVSLSLARSLLPKRTVTNLGLLAHIHAHSGFQKKYGRKSLDKPKIKKRVSRSSLMGLLDSLESTIKKLSFRPGDGDWGDYYSGDSYTPGGFEHKKQVVGEFIDEIKPKSVWDLGANRGLFGRLASARGIPTISFDSDPECVEKNYLCCVENKEENILPLILDLTNPSPAVGWRLRERLSIFERGPADTVLALALLHHLAISNNIPLDDLAGFFSGICSSLIIEFVPKDDPMVRKMLSMREDIFRDYNKKEFEENFSKHFKIQSQEDIKDSKRTIYLMKKKTTEGDA